MEAVEGLEVTLAGSATSDQMCGQRLVADVVMPEAVDVEQFKAEMVTASGAASPSKATLCAGPSRITREIRSAAAFTVAYARPAMAPE